MVQSLERWHFFTPKAQNKNTDLEFGKSSAEDGVIIYLFILAATKFLHYSI